MNYINEVRDKCYNKMVNSMKMNDFEKVELYRKIGLYLSNATFFMSVDIDVAFKILSLLGYSDIEIDKIYPKLISYNSLFLNDENEKKIVGEL